MIIDGFCVDGTSFWIWGIKIKIFLTQIIDATSYEIEIYKSGVLIETLTKTDLVFEYMLSDFGNYEFRYRGKNGSLYSDWSEAKTIKYNYVTKMILLNNSIA